MGKAKKEKLHRRDYYYIFGAVGAIVAIGLALALTSTPGEASAVIAHGERVAYHKHAFIEYYLDGVKQTVPADIGVPLDDSHPLARHGPSGIAPVHTHDNTGLLHLESKDQRDYTFGDFLALWEPDLTDNRVLFFANDQPVTDMNSYVIQDQDTMRLEVMSALQSP